MKASELINELIKLKKQYGDREVYVEDPDYGDGEHSTTQVRHDGDGGFVIWHYFGPYCRECHRGCD